MSSTIFKTFLQIQNTAGTNAKKEILKNNMSPTLRLIFEDTYGSQKYYIKMFVPDGEYGNLSIDNDYGTFHCTRVDLVTRTVTGDAAYRHLQKTVALYDYESQEILYKIIDRNLKIGVSLDNFLDVIGEKETKFEVALAIFKAGNKSSFESFINTVKFTFEILTENDTIMTRAAAAEVLCTFAKTI